MAKNFVSLDKLTLFLEKVKGLIPKRLSQLENDDNFVKDAAYVHTDNNFDNDAKAKLAGIEAEANKYVLPTASSTVKGGIKVGAGLKMEGEVLSREAGGVADTVPWTGVTGRPTKVSEFTNDSGFITNAVGDLLNYYAKSSTYNKDEVNDLIAAVKTIKFEVVAQLPEKGESNIIYLVAHEGSAANNTYDEFAWIEASNKFEKIGSTDIDLSQYWSKTELVEVTDQQINAMFAA